MKRHSCSRRANPIDAVCLALIGFYQRQISPRKGYRCAYARLNGGGCSSFVRVAIEQNGLSAALPQIRARFGECKNAARILRAEAGVDLDKRGEKTAAKQSKARGNGTDHALCNAVAMAPDGICCLGEAALQGGGVCEGVGCAEAACGCLPCL